MVISEELWELVRLAGPVTHHYFTRKTLAYAFSRTKLGKTTMGSSWRLDLGVEIRQQPIPKHANTSVHGRLPPLNHHFQQQQLMPTFNIIEWTPAEPIFPM